MTRSCEECSACCFALGITKLKKPNFTPCAHQCAGGGCSIYDSKPQECGDFDCAWLEGKVGDDSQRPDKTGLVVFIPVTQLLRPFATEIHVYEASYAASEEPSNRAFIKKLMLDGYVVRVSAMHTAPLSQYHLHNTLPAAEAVSDRLLSGCYALNTYG